MKAKRDRNARLIRFHAKHPDYTHAAIAKVFHMDRSRVTRILLKGKEEANGAQS